MFAIDAVACVPGHAVGVETEVRDGFATIKNKSTLVPLKVVHSDMNHTYGVGSTVYVLGDAIKQMWFKTEYTVDGVTFVLVPTKDIKMVRPV